MIPGIQKLISPKALAFVPLLGLTNKKLVELTASEIGSVAKAASTLMPLPKAVILTLESMIARNPEITMRELVDGATVKQLTEAVLTQYALVQAEMPVETTVDMIQDCDECGHTIVRKGTLSESDGAVQLKKCECPHCKTSLKGI